MGWLVGHPGGGEHISLWCTFSGREYYLYCILQLPRGTLHLRVHEKIKSAVPYTRGKMVRVWFIYLACILHVYSRRSVVTGIKLREVERRPERRQLHRSTGYYYCSSDSDGYKKYSVLRMHRERRGRRPKKNKRYRGATVHLPRRVAAITVFDSRVRSIISESGPPKSTLYLNCVVGASR